MKKIKVDFRPLIHRLELLTRKFVDSEFSGESPTLQKRKGIEFEDFKLFSPGDDASQIDWKSSLRAKQLLLRQYTQLKSISIFVLLDVSNSMLFSSTPKLKCEYGAELAASVSSILLKADNLVGLGLFSDSMVRFIPPNLGSSHFGSMTRSLGNPHLYGGGFNLSKSINQIQSYIRSGSVVIVISDFLGLEKNWYKPLQALSANCDVICLIVRDPEDMRLNERVGQTIIEDPFSDQILLIDVERASKSFEEQARNQLRAVQAQLKRFNVESLVLTTSQPFVDPIVKFFGRRRFR